MKHLHVQVVRDKLGRHVFITVLENGTPRRFVDRVPHYEAVNFRNKLQEKLCEEDDVTEVTSDEVPYPVDYLSREQMRRARA